MRIAVTGAGGQLGLELCRQLGAAAVDLDLPAFDLADQRVVAATLRAIRPQAIINAAAYTQVDKAETEVERCRSVNARGVAHLVEVCRELDCPLVQVSTDYVFGRELNRRTPYRETDAPGPQGIYALTKAEGEREATQWPTHFIVRTSGLYGRLGPRSGGNFVETMLRLGRERRPLRVVNDQQCTPSYVPHVARAILFLLETSAYGIYHVVNSGGTTWYQFAAEIFRQTGLEMPLEPITTAEYGARAPRPSYSILDSSKYHDLPGCPALPAWQQALAEYLSVREPSEGR